MRFHPGNVMVLCVLFAATTLMTPDLRATAQRPADKQPANNSFAKVAAKLDQGGSFYMVWDVGRSLRRTVESLAEVATVSGDPQARLGAPILRSALKELGLWNLGFLGISHQDQSQGGHRCVMFLEVPERKGLLNLQGDPRSLDLLGIFPAETLLVSAAALEFSRLIPLVEDIAGGVAGMVGRQSIVDGLDKKKEKDNVDLRTLLAGLGNEVALGFWLDPKEKITIQGPRNHSLEIPRPRLAVAVNASTNTLVHLALHESQRKEKNGQLVRFDDWETLVGQPAPRIPDLHPVLAWKPGMLIFTESTTTLRILESTRESGRDIRTSPGWKAMSNSLPKNILKVLYLSPAGSQAVLDSLNQLPAASREEKAARRVIGRLIAWLAGGMMAVTTYEDGGYLHISLTAPPPASPSKP